MAQVFSQSAEYDKLKADWALKKQYLLDKFADLKVSESDKKLAGQTRGLVSEYNAIIDMEEAIDKYFDNTEQK